MRFSPPSFLLLTVAVFCCAPETADEWHQEAIDHLGGQSLRDISSEALVFAQRAEEHALEIDSTRTDISLKLAEILQARGYYESASDLYRKIIEMNADVGSAYSGLGFSLSAQGRFGAAQRAYQDALRRGERSSLLYSRLGHSYQALGHIREHLISARAAYRAALQLDPKQADVHLQWARVEMRLGDSKTARDLYEEALELNERDLDARIELAQLYLELGENTVGRALLADGLHEPEDDALLLQELGRFLWEEGESVSALSHFESALDLNPLLSVARRIAALIYSEMGEYKRALSYYTILIGENEKDTQLWINRGIIHSQMGEFVAAEADFKYAILLGGTNGDGALKLGGLYVHTRNKRAAVKVLSDGVTDYPNNAELQATLGDIYREMGILNAALKAGEKAVELEPDRALWRYHLARTYERSNPEYATKEWARYFELAAEDTRERNRSKEVQKRLKKNYD
ncbi:MAG: tetratricopeptide repeat protein [Candidatus Latescibacterota bacterium]|nr:tetratricopeptide repeat protein [Candidatus Latescibacterota bacterium]